MARNQHVLKMPSNRMVPPVQGATALMGAAPHWHSSARLCGGQVPGQHPTPALPLAFLRAALGVCTLAGSTSVGCCSVREAGNLLNVPPALSPPTMDSAKLSRLTATLTPMSWYSRAPSARRERFAWMEAARTSVYTDLKIALLNATTMGFATTRGSATVTRAGPHPTVHSCWQMYQHPRASQSVWLWSW